MMTESEAFTFACLLLVVVAFKAGYWMGGYDQRIEHNVRSAATK